LITDGANPANLTIFDTRGSLHSGREDIRTDTRFYRKWELCQQTNPSRIQTIEEAMKGADVLIALSTPGPDTVKPEWIRSMAKKAIVFACANPVPEIYPYAAKEAGAFIVGTGRGDFPNQINNSICFPAILNGALLVRARKITDQMAIRAAHSLAEFAEKRGITPDNIVPSMNEAAVFAEEAADVAMQAIADGVARITRTREEALQMAKQQIQEARDLFQNLMDKGFIKEPPQAMIEEAFQWACSQVK
jgi:malate dehydrogenase (oxaloacetate-decarboxylating)